MVVAPAATTGLDVAIEMLEGDEVPQVWSGNEPGPRSTHRLERRSWLSDAYRFEPGHLGRSFGSMNSPLKRSRNCSAWARSAKQ